MKKNQKNNRGTANSPQAAPTFSYCDKLPPSTSNNSEISKYFVRKSDECNKKPCMDFDTPYKDIITAPKVILNDSLQDENEFKTPKLLKKNSKVTNKCNRKTKRKRLNSKTGVQKKLTNMIKDNFAYTDTNAEHLQMALALSKSEQSEETDHLNTFSYPSTQTKMLFLRKTLEQFGFKTDKPAKRNPEPFKRSKKSRFQYITPILFLRTEEDRQKMISVKTSLILSRNSIPQYSYFRGETEIKSQYLSEFICKGSKIFNLNNISYEEMENDQFYVKDLNIEIDETKCGYLLKDWLRIPGREKTPPRNTEVQDRKVIIDDFDKERSENFVSKPNDVINEEELQLKSHDINLQNNLLPDNSNDNLTRRIRSPDLFSSEDEEVIKINKSIANELQLSSEVNNIKENILSKPLLSDSDISNVHVASSSIILISDDEHTDSPNLTDVSVDEVESNKNSITPTNQRSSFAEELSLDNLDVSDNRFTSELNNFSTIEQGITDEIDENVFQETDVLEKFADVRVTSSNIDRSTAMYDFQRSTRSQSKKISYSKVNINDDDDDENNKEITEINSESMLIRNESLVGLERSDFDILEDKRIDTQISTIDNLKNDEKSSKMTKDTSLKNIEVRSKDTSMLSSSSSSANESDKENFIDNNNLEDKINDSDEMLETLEVTFMKTTQNVIPKGKNIDAFSASLLSNFECLNRTDTHTKQGESSDDYSYRMTYESMNGIEHFESFCGDPEVSKAKIYDLTKSDEECDEKNRQDESNCNSMNDQSLNVTDYIDNILGQSYYMADSYKENNDRLEVSKVVNIERKREVLSSSDDTNDSTINKDIDTKNMEPSSSSDIHSDKLKCNTKTKYQISSDSEGADIYEVKEAEYDSSHIKVLSRKSLGKKCKLRKSVSFTSSNRSFKKSFRKSSSFSTLSRDKCQQDEFKRYPSKSSVSSESTTADEVICVSDEELNYSSVHSTPYYKKHKLNGKELKSDEIEDADRSINILNENEEDNLNSYSYLEKYYEGYDDNYHYYNENENLADTQEDRKLISPVVHPRVSQLSNKNVSLFRKSIDSILKTSPITNNISIIAEASSNNETPNGKKQDQAVTPDDHVIIKRKNVTPMPDYDNMSTPTIARELEKIGVKQLKRHRGIQILKHIYETTHPILPNQEEDDSEDNRIVKKPKLSQPKSRRNLEMECYANFDIELGDGIVKTVMDENQTIEIVGDIPESENLIFERKQSKKIATCQVPLHIAWHNLVSSNPQLRENILLYIPLQLEVLYTMLKEQGYKYHVQDLLTFLDKKCITVRINQNSGQSRRKRF